MPSNQPDVPGVPELGPNFRPTRKSLSNSEVMATGILGQGAVLNIARELVQLRAKNAALESRLETLTKPVTFTYDEIDELCCEWGEPRYLQTEDGEAWFWKFEGSDLPVADNLAELLLAARQLLASRAPTPASTKGDVSRVSASNLS